MKVKLTDVTESIFAGGDVLEDRFRFSEAATDKYKIPIYANAEKDNSLYGDTDTQMKQSRGGVIPWQIV